MDVVSSCSSALLSPTVLKDMKMKPASCSIYLPIDTSDSSGGASAMARQFDKVGTEQTNAIIEELFIWECMVTRGRKVVSEGEEIFHRND